MLLAVDVAYDDAASRGNAAGVVFRDWADGAAVEERTVACMNVAPYEPGAFYRRELPCLMPLVEACCAAFPIHTVIIDGYVDLGARPGLGRHLVEALAALGLAPAVVGVAKSRFEAASAVEILRGASIQPLYVTAHGIAPDAAAREVQRMHGEHRIPTLLRRVDQLARQIR